MWVSEVVLFQYFCSCSQTPPPTCGWFWVNLSSLSPNRADVGLNFQPDKVPCFSPWSRGLLLLFSPKNQWVFKCQRRTRSFFTPHLEVDEGFPRGSVVKSQCRRGGFDPGVRKIPWRRKWQPTPVFLLGKSHGLSSLAGYSPWVAKSWTWLSN